MVTLEPKYLMDAGGGRISVQGSGEFSGGLDPGAFVGAGVLGFLQRGEEVVVPAGTMFEVTTDQEARVAASSVTEDSEPLSHCRDFFRFAEADVVPLEEVELHAPYAPFGTSLTVALPLAALQDGQRINRYLRNLLAFDTAIQSLIVATEKRRRSVDLDLTIVLVVLPSHDKRVNLRVALVDGEEVFARAERLNVDAEEEKTKAVNMRLKADPERFDRALASGEGRLKVEMHVRE